MSSLNLGMIGNCQINALIDERGNIGEAVVLQAFFQLDGPVLANDRVAGNVLLILVQSRPGTVEVRGDGSWPGARVNGY